MALVVVFGLRVVAPAVPGALVLVVGGLLAYAAARPRASAVWRWSATCRAGCRRLDVPDPALLWDHARHRRPAAVALVLIGFSQTAGDARAFATKHRYQVDVNQETVAQGMANAGAGLLQGMPVTTSLSASSLNDHAGATTGLASLTSGVIVLLTLLFLAPLFSDLPKPVLAALIIEAVVMGMMDLPEMRRLARVQRFDFWVAVTAILGTLAFGVLAGVIFGIGLSLLWLVAVTTRPAMPLLGRRSGTTVFRELAEFPDDEQFPGVAVVRLDGGLFFATSDALDERVRQVIRETAGRDLPRPRLLGDQLRRLPGRGAADEVVTLTEEEGVTLRLARLKPVVAATLGRDGVLPRIPGIPDPRQRRRCRAGPGRLHPGVIGRGCRE